MERKKIDLIAMLVLLVMLALSCNGIEEDSQGLFTETEAQQTLEPNTNVPGYWGGVVPWEYDDEAIVPVLVDGQPEVTTVSSKSASSLGGIEFVTPEGNGGSKASSTLSDGTGFYMANNVDVSEVNGMTFTPADGDPAFAMYELAAPADTPFTVGIAWYSLPEAMDSYFVGIGDNESGIWHWYQGPGDGVLTFNPDDWKRPGNIDDTVLVCIAVEAGKPADFWQVNWGVSEIRGTGLAYEDSGNAPQLPPREGKSASEVLPAEFSLRTYLPPISNQGSMGSCTAFACNDAAFNILLDQLYGNGGWDISNNTMRTSPMWSYVKSGIAPIGSWNPPCGSSVGRYMSQAFNVLEQIGTAVQDTVPYQATSNCATTFIGQADTEANLLQISNWYGLGSNSGTIVESVKTQLAENGQPVVVAMYGLESAFLNYSSGVYHYGGTYGVNGGHAMCIVGYDDSIQAFDVRNSWGGNWGASGYWWCGYDAVEDLIAEGSRMDLFTMTAEYNADAATHFLGEAIITDETEPNDNLETANSLPVFPLEGYSADLGNGDTTDYFSFAFSANNSTDFSLSYDPADGVITLGLYDPSDNLLAESATGSGIEELSGTWGNSGTAYLKASLVSGSAIYYLTGSESTPPTAPQNLAATDGTRDDGVMLTWDSVPNTVFYKVFRADEFNGNYLEVATPVSPQHLDSSAQALTTYWYKVSAVGLTGESLASSVDSGSRTSPQPTGFSATDNAFADKVVLTWDSVPGWTTFTVKRSMFENGPFDPLANVDGVTYDDTSVEPGSTYYYVVCLVTDGHYGPQSAIDAGSASGQFEQHEGVVDDSEVDDNVNNSGNGTLPGNDRRDPADGQGTPVVPSTQ